MKVTQYQRVKTILSKADRPLALFEIAAMIRLEFGRYDSDAAISARIRDIRHDLEKSNQGTIAGKIAGKGKHHYIYEMIKE